MELLTEFNNSNRFFSQLAKGIAGKQHQRLNMQSIIFPASVGEGMIHVISKSPEFFFTIVNVDLQEQFSYQSIESTQQSNCADFVYENYESNSSFLGNEEYFTVDRPPGKWQHLTIAIPKSMLPANKPTQEIHHIYNRFSANPYIKNTLKALFDIKIIDCSKMLSMEAKALDIASLWLNFLQQEVKQDNKLYLTSYHEACLQDAKQILDQQYHTPLTIKQLARQIGMSPSSLRNGFRQLFNTTIRQYSIQLRMEKACQLLKETELPLSQICFLVGYNNEGHFADIFKRNYGKSPFAYRQEFRKLG